MSPSSACTKLDPTNQLFPQEEGFWTGFCPRLHTSDFPQPTAPLHNNGLETHLFYYLDSRNCRINNYIYKVVECLFVHMSLWRARSFKVRHYEPDIFSTSIIRERFLSMSQIAY